MSRVWSRCLCLVGLAAALTGWASGAAADCTSPAGPEGSLNYNATSHEFEFCDETDTWQSLGGGGAGGGFEDHIISGTTNVYVNSATSTISFTTNGSVANYFDASGRLVTTGISVTTNQLSATTGYFSGNVGVGTATPQARMDILDSSTNAKAYIRASPVDAPGVTSRLYLGLLGVENQYTPRKVFIGAFGVGNWGTQARLDLGTSPNENDWGEPVPQLSILQGGNVGIGTVTPTATLQVSGTFIVSTSSAPTSPSLYVTSAGNVGVGVGSGIDTTSKLHVAGTGIYLYELIENISTGYARLWFKRNGTYVGSIGVNNAGVFGLSADNGVDKAVPDISINTSGKVGIGWVTPTVALEVSGTISATNFVGNGSGLTGIVVQAQPSDRISTTNVASGATLGMAVADKGTVSFTLGGTAGAAYLHPTLGFVGPGVSTTGGISGTTGYFAGNVTGSADNTYNVGSTTRRWAELHSVSDYSDEFKPHAGGASRFCVDDSCQGGLFTTGGSDGLRVSTNRMDFINSGGGSRGYIVSGEVHWTPDKFTVSTVGSGYILLNGGNVGIGTVTPTATLQVSGTFTVSSTGQVTTPTLYTTAGGNVGIGTTNPGVKLEVTSSSDDLLRLTHSSGSGSPRLTLYADTAEKGRLEWNAPASNLKLQSAGGFNLSVGGVEHVNVTSSGNVGIGTANPLLKLSVTGASAAYTGNSGIFQVTTGTGASTDEQLQLGVVNGSYGWIQASKEGTAVRSLALNPSGGNVGIGTASPNQGKIEVKSGTVCVDTDSDDNATSCIADESDARLKQNVRPLTGALYTIEKLRGVTFDWRVSDSTVLKHYPLIQRFAANPHSVGLIAQEVSPIFPYAIEQETVGDKDVQYFQLDYTKFVPLLIEAVKELKEQASVAQYVYTKEIGGLKAANDNLVSKTTMLELQLKAANDNHEKDAAAIEELRQELRDLKNGAGWQRSGAASPPAGASHPRSPQPPRQGCDDHRAGSRWPMLRRVEVRGRVVKRLGRIARAAVTDLQGGRERRSGFANVRRDGYANFLMDSVPCQEEFS